MLNKIKLKYLLILSTYIGQESYAMHPPDIETLGLEEKAKNQFIDHLKDSFGKRISYLKTIQSIEQAIEDINNELLYINKKLEEITTTVNGDTLYLLHQLQQSTIPGYKSEISRLTDKIKELNRDDPKYQTILYQLTTERSKLYEGLTDAKNKQDDMYNRKSEKLELEKYKEQKIYELERLIAKKQEMKRPV